MHEISKRIPPVLLYGQYYFYQLNKGAICWYDPFIFAFKLHIIVYITYGI
jgi:hypothetical protein